MKKLKINYNKIIVIFIVLICIIFVCFHGYNIIKWNIDSNNTKKQVDNINDLIKAEEISDSEKTEVIGSREILSKDNPYFDYIKMKMINVNFDDLKKINSDAKGWINVNGTNINYPFVQAKDNKYYLTHSFDKSYNRGGWVFLDYRNNEINKHTILYAHSRFDNTMFGSLKNILSDGWLDNKDNFVIKMSTVKENSLWQIFSIYHIPYTSDYLKVEFYDDNDFLNFTSMLKNRSTYNFDTSINEDDKILTLSTCYNKNDRLVVHAKLIKKENKM